MNPQQLKVFWLLVFWVLVIALGIHLASEAFGG